VDARLQEMKKPREMVIEDPEILSGTPVVRGTRVAAYDIAAAFDSGTPVERLLSSYPSLKEWQIKLASLYARAVPPRGRPRRKPIPSGVKVFSVKRRLRNPSTAG
jgi:uncharacterized protein (DUF433 family)